MRKTALLIVLFPILLVPAQAQEDIQRLYDSKDYIRLSHSDIESWDIAQLPTPLVRAYMYSAMARYEKSNKEIELIMEAIDSIAQNRNLMAEMIYLQAVNYTKNHRYKQAAGCYKEILDSYGDLLGESFGGYQNAYRIYNSLSGVKPLQADILHDTRISMQPDKKGIPLVQVSTPKDSVSLIFDTGATFSCVSKSVAEKLGIQILADSLVSGSATTIMNYMSIGVADTLYLGDIVYQNAVFLVIEDEKLTHPEHDYGINGTLGFPEMQILQAIKIHKNGILEICKNEEKHKSNMMFSENKQIIVQANDSLLFWLDTGADWSLLSVNYYNKNRSYIEKVGELTTKVINGIGGSEEFPVYKLKNFPVKINTATTILPEIPCFIQSSVTNFNEYDAMLGLDIIGQYDYMLLDFKNMYFALGNTEQRDN